LKSILDSQSTVALASALRGMALRHDLSSVLAASTQPTLIITGDEDALISSLQSEAMHRLARNSKLVTISKAGHLSSLERPDEWNSAVAEYFR
jgi:pimeloyl-ACP methyl ester carboxylesterase